MEDESNREIDRYILLLRSNETARTELERVVVREIVEAGRLAGFDITEHDVFETFPKPDRYNQWPRTT